MNDRDSIMRAMEDAIKGKDALIQELLEDSYMKGKAIKNLECEIKLLKEMNSYVV